MGLEDKKVDFGAKEGENEWPFSGVPNILGSKPSEIGSFSAKELAFIPKLLQKKGMRSKENICGTEQM